MRFDCFAAVSPASKYDRAAAQVAAVQQQQQAQRRVIPISDYQVRFDSCDSARLRFLVPFRSVRRAHSGWFVRLLFDSVSTRASLGSTASRR